MSDTLVTLLKQRYSIEQRIHQLNTTEIAESKRGDADAMAARLEDALNHINEGIRSIKRNMGAWKDVQSRKAMDVGRPKSYRQPGERPKADDREETDRLMQQFLAKGGKIKKESSDSSQEPDHEVNMARSDLHRAAHASIALSKMLSHISEQQGLEGWVQAKITKAADYLDTVYHYLEYEMKDVSEATYGPGEDPNQPVQAPGAPQQNPNQAKPGQTSPTPPAGGASPGGGTPGMVKMAKMGPDKKPQGTPIMVRSTDIASKQKAGYFVIGESKEEKKVVHCSQCGKGFSGGGLKPPYHTGFSHCKDHKGMKIVAEDASAGASSAGAMGGSPTGFASGGIGMQKRKKKKFEEVEETVEKEEGPKFTGYWKGKDKDRPGKKMVGGD